MSELRNPTNDATPPTLSVRIREWVRRYGKATAIVFVLLAFLFGESVVTILKGDFTPIKNLVVVVLALGAGITIIMVPVTAATFWRDHPGFIRRSIGKAGVLVCVGGFVALLWYDVAVPLLHFLVGILQVIVEVIQLMLRKLG